MSTHYDEKGKFFTDIISKKDVPVTIQTLHNSIEGIVHIRRGERLKDELNEVDHRNHIIWIFPQTGEDEDLGDQT
jgi:hypothetical protein